MKSITSSPFFYYPLLTTTFLLIIIFNQLICSSSQPALPPRRRRPEAEWEAEAMRLCGDAYLRDLSLSPEAEALLSQAVNLRLSPLMNSYPLHYEAVLFTHFHAHFVEQCVDDQNQNHLRFDCPIANLLQDMGLLSSSSPFRGDRSTVRRLFEGHWTIFHAEATTGSATTTEAEVKQMVADYPVTPPRPLQSLLGPLVVVNPGGFSSVPYSALLGELISYSAVLGEARRDHLNPPTAAVRFRLIKRFLGGAGDGGRYQQPSRLNRRLKLQLLFLLTAGGHFLQWIENELKTGAETGGGGGNALIDAYDIATLRALPPPPDHPEVVVFGGQTAASSDSMSPPGGNVVPEEEEVEVQDQDPNQQQPELDQVADLDYDQLISGVLQEMDSENDPDWARFGLAAGSINELAEASGAEHQPEKEIVDSANPPLQAEDLTDELFNAVLQELEEGIAKQQGISGGKISIDPSSGFIIPMAGEEEGESESDEEEESEGEKTPAAAAAEKPLPRRPPPRPRPPRRRYQPKAYDFNDRYLERVRLPPEAVHLLETATTRLTTAMHRLPLHYEAVLFSHLFTFLVDDCLLPLDEGVVDGSLTSDCAFFLFLQDLGLLPRPYRVKGKLTPVFSADWVAFYQTFKDRAEELKVADYSMALLPSLAELLPAAHLFYLHDLSVDPGWSGQSPPRPQTRYSDLLDELLANSEQQAVRRASLSRGRNAAKLLNSNSGQNRRRKQQLLFLLTIGGHFLQWVGWLEQQSAGGGGGGGVQQIDANDGSVLRRLPPPPDHPEVLLFGPAGGGGGEEGGGEEFQQEQQPGANSELLLELMPSGLANNDNNNVVLPKGRKRPRSRSKMRSLDEEEKEEEKGSGEGEKVQNRKAENLGHHHHQHHHFLPSLATLLLIGATIAILALIAMMIIAYTFTTGKGQQQQQIEEEDKEEEGVIITTGSNSNSCSSPQQKQQEKQEEEVTSISSRANFTAGHF